MKSLLKNIILIVLLVFSNCIFGKNEWRRESNNSLLKVSDLTTFLCKIHGIEDTLVSCSSKELYFSKFSLENAYQNAFKKNLEIPQKTTMNKCDLFLFDDVSELFSIAVDCYYELLKINYKKGKVQLSIVRVHQISNSYFNLNFVKDKNEWNFKNFEYIKTEDNPDFWNKNE